MNYTAIKVDDYWIIISDQKVQTNEVGFFDNRDGSKPDDYDIALIKQRGIELLEGSGRIVPKVIACSKELNGLPVFVPEWENEAYNIAEKLYQTTSMSNQIHRLNMETDRKIFIEGYNKAKEKYRFTLEDMEKVFASGMTAKKYESELPTPRVRFQNFIESITKPKQYQVEIGSVSDNRIEVKSWTEV